MATACSSTERCGSRSSGTCTGARALQLSWSRSRPDGGCRRRAAESSAAAHRRAVRAWLPRRRARPRRPGRRASALGRTALSRTTSGSASPAESGSGTWRSSQAPTRSSALAAPRSPEGPTPAAPTCRRRMRPCTTREVLIPRRTPTTWSRRASSAASAPPRTGSAARTGSSSSRPVRSASAAPSRPCAPLTPRPAACRRSEWGRRAVVRGVPARHAARRWDHSGHPLRQPAPRHVRAHRCAPPPTGAALATLTLPLRRSPTLGDPCAAPDSDGMPALPPHA